MTIEERLSLLEQQIAAQVPTPTEYYTSRWSGEEIDKGIGGALQLGGATTPQAALRNIGGRPNRNLLDNAYFKGGGSQQGGGQFPINQRGQGSYTGAVYGIDRWKGLYGSELVALENGCLSLTFSNNQGISQILAPDVLQALEGQTVTQTILWYLSSGNYANAGLVVNETPMLAPGIQSVGSQWMITSKTVQMPDSIQSASFNISGDGNIKVKAVKLELGDHQTLAYQDESGAWQLFETPDYGEELAKCRYYFRRYGVSSLGQIFLPPALGVSGTEANFSIVSEPMRIAPTISGNGFRLAGTTGDGFIADGSASFSLLGASPLSGIITVKVTCSNRTLIPGNYYTLYANPEYGAFLDLSAEL